MSRAAENLEHDADAMREALEVLPSGELRVRLVLAQTAMFYGQTPRVRGQAMREIDAIKSELAARVDE